MSDPLLPELSDAAKVGGGGVVATALTLVAGRLFGSQDKVIARLEVMQAELSDVRTKLAVLVAASERRDDDVERLKGTVEEQGKAIARLEATVQQLSEGVAR